MEDDPSSICIICWYPSWTTECILDQGNWVVQLDSYAKLKASADNGCPGCFILERAWTYSPDRANKVLNFNKSSGHLWINFSPGVGLDIFTLQHEPRFMHLKTASFLPPSTHLEYNLPQIVAWLGACEKLHPSCSKSSVYVPPRLLYVSSEDLKTVKLVELAPEENTAPRYACLSHCWGNIRSKHNTTCSTLSQNFESIVVNELPQTFRDAIQVTRALRIRYLWIDSLCIIQDSSSDWERHVSAMAHIYENGYITLAAGASIDDNGGLFSTTPSRYTKTGHFQLKIKQNMHIIFLRHRVEHFDVYFSDDILPLMKRGWCFQERLLSRRFLCFGTKEILWECLEDIACSCSMAAGPFNPPILNDMDMDYPRFQDSPGTKWQLGMIREEKDGDYAQIWQDLVHQYTKRKLTYPSDRLSALAGLASMFERSKNLGKYLFGLFSNSLPQSLGWSLQHESPSSARPRYGPSWSWAFAIDGIISWDNLLWDESLKLLEIVAPKKRRGVSKVAEFEGGNAKDRPEPYKLLKDLVTSVRENPHLNMSGAAFTELQEKGANFYADFKFWSSEDDLQQQIQNVIFCLMGSENDVWNLDGTRHTEGKYVAELVLRVAETSGDGNRYERIGWLRYGPWISRKHWQLAGR